MIILLSIHLKTITKNRENNKSKDLQQNSIARLHAYIQTDANLQQQKLKDTKKVLY